MAKRKYMEALAQSADMFGEFKEGNVPQSFDALFKLDKTDKSSAETMIPIGKAHPSPRNPYIVEHDAAMDELIASIKQNGILVPLIVRPYGNEYEVIAGHRRLYAAKAAGFTEVPVIVKELSDVDADIIMVDSNLNRPNVRISERAFAYKLKYEAIKKKVGRNWDIIHISADEKSNCEPGSQLENKSEKSNCEPGSQLENKSEKFNCEPGSQLDNKSEKFNCEPGSQLKSRGQLTKSADVIAEEMGVSDRTIQQYLRLTNLDRKLLDMVDAKELPIKAGVQLSYISFSVQDAIHGVATVEKVEIDVDLAKKLRSEFEEKPDAAIDDVMRFLVPGKEPKPKKKTPCRIRINKELRSRYFPKDFDDAQIETITKELYDSWAKRNNPGYFAYTGGERT